jgi:hypothetical protein
MVDKLVTFVAGLLALISSAIHADGVKFWDGTTLRLEMNGLVYQATCKSSTGWAGSPAPRRGVSGESDFQFAMRFRAWRAAPTPPAVTYPNCGLPPIWEREQGTERGDFYWDWWNDTHTLSLRRGSRAAGGQWAWRQDDFAISSARAIGWGLFPD